MLRPPGPTAPNAGPAAAPAAPGADIASNVPGNVDLRAVRLSFQIPENRTFAQNWKYTAKTSAPTTIGLEVTPQGLRIWTSPGLHFDVQWPAQNMRMYGAGVNFTSGQPYAEFSPVRGMGEGFIDVTETGEKTVRDMIASAIAGTSMANPGYDPLRDPNIMQTLSRIKANFDAMPPAPGAGAGVAPAEVSRPTVGASLAMKSPFVKQATGGGVSIPAGGGFDISIQGTGNLAQILAAGTQPQAAAMAAGIQQIDVSSESIQLLKGNGEPIAKLQSLVISRGGQVRLDRFEMLGGLGTGAGIETLIRLLVAAGTAASQGLPGEVGVGVAAQNGGLEPELVRGVSRKMIEDALSESVRKLLTENRHAVPGLDLGLVFGVR